MHRKLKTLTSVIAMSILIVDPAMAMGKKNDKRASVPACTQSPGARKPACDCDAADRALKAADEALAKKNEALKLSDLALKNCQEQSGNLAAENAELHDKQNSWLRNPVVMFVFGAAAAAVTYTLIKR